MTASEQARVVLDCRWLVRGGPGRVTELLLRGMAAAPPPGRWVLWGPPAVEAFAWPGSELEVTTDDPRALAGQRAWRSVPEGDAIVFMHQVRPLLRANAVSWVYDTIPVRFARSWPVRTAKTLYLRRLVAASRRIVTASEFSKGRIQTDVGAPAEKVAVARLPVDEGFAARVDALRGDRPVVDRALFVGRFAPHKNLPRLVRAFGRTDFRRRGATLLLVGGDEGELEGLGHRLTAEERDYVSFLRRCGQEQLDELFASSRLAIQPSLDEGFGLPAWEALTCGLPLCVSDGGALPEITAGLVDPFPAESEDAMVAAIDDCAERAVSDPGHAGEVAEELRSRAPTLGEFATNVVAVVEGVLSSRLTH